MMATGVAALHTQQASETASPALLFKLYALKFKNTPAEDTPERNDLMRLYKKLPEDSSTQRYTKKISQERFIEKFGIDPDKPVPIIPGTFTMVTLSTPNREAFARLVEENQRKYAQQHGYGYVKYYRTLDPSRPEEWSKIRALSRQLGESGAEWLLWIDDDIVITNPSITLESFVNRYGRDKDLIIARDAYYKRGVPINNGIFLVRNTPWARNFLNEVWKKGAEWYYLTRGKSLLEQQTMTDLLYEPYRKKLVYTDKTVVIPQREMNSFLRTQDGYQDPIEARWQSGDFAAHVTGMPLQERERIIKNLVSLYS